MTTEDRRTRRLREDAAKFLELLITSCEDEDEHRWTKCRHCLALWELDGNQPLARGFLETAIQALRAAVLDTEGDRQEPEAHSCEKHGTMVARDESGSRWYCAVCGADTEGDPPHVEDRRQEHQCRSHHPIYKQRCEGESGHLGAHDSGEFQWA